MAGPWEEYQKPQEAPKAKAPWEEYQTAPAAAATNPWEEYSTASSPQPESPQTAPGEKTGTESGVLLDTELQKISKDTGVPLETLRSVAPYFGARAESDESTEAKVKRVAGFLDEAVTMGALKGAYKKLGTSDAEEKALDVIQRKAEERKSGLEKVGELAGGFVVPFGGALKEGSMLAKLGYGALMGAGLGGVSAVAHSEKGEEVKHGLFGAALGAGIGAAGAGLGHAFETMRAKMPEAAERVEDVLRKKVLEESPRLEAEAKEVLDAVAAGTRPASKEGLQTAQNFLGYIKANSLLEDSAKLEGLGSERVVEGLNAVKNQMGEDWLNKEFRNFQLGEMAEDVLSKEKAQFQPREANVGRKAARFLLDGRAVGRSIDRRTGVTALEPFMDEASREINIMKGRQHAFFQDAKPVIQQLEEMGADRLTAADLRLAEEGGIKALPKDLQPIFETYQQYMSKGPDSVLKKMQAMGLPVKDIAESKAKVYIPKLTKNAAEASAEVISRARDLGINPKGQVPALWTESIERLANGEEVPKNFQELVSGAEWLSGRKIEDADDLSLALKTILNPSEVTANMRKKIRAVQSRGEEGVPDFLRETDLAKLTGRYLSDTIEGHTMQPIVSELSRQGRLAKMAGDIDGADYVENLVRDLNGQREGTLSSYLSKKSQEFKLHATDAALRLEKEGKPRQAALASWLAEAPDFMSSIQKNVYPNFLGANPRAAINNLTQAFFVTTPELGGTYGTGKVLKATGKTLAEMKGLIGKGELKRLMEESGQLGIQAHQESYAALREGLKASGGFAGLPKKALDKAASASMALFEVSERLNRRIVQNVAEDVAGDLVAKSGNRFYNANKFIQNVGPAYKTRIMQAVESGNKEEVQRLVENYLTGKTMFNYNKLTMSEYGRTMGPIFSVFSKWPSVIAGDIVNTMGEKGLLKGSFDNARRYLGPILAANMVEKATDFDQNDPRNRALFGQHGLATAAPGYALTSITHGDIFSPPGVSIAKKLATGLVTLDPYQMWSAGNDAAAAYTPGSFILRLMGTDVPRLRGENPQGTFLGKLAPELDEAAKEGRTNIQNVFQ